VLAVLASVTQSDWLVLTAKSLYCGVLGARLSALVALAADAVPAVCGAPNR
jgi:hypothetical protein